MRRFLLALCLIGCSSSNDASGTNTSTTPLVAGLSIGDVSLYQALKVPLAAGGQPVFDRNVPIVAGRQALLRVSVVPDESWEPRSVTARLELQNDQGPLEPLELPLVVNGASVEGDLTTSFDFDLPGSVVTPDLGFSVELIDSEPGRHGPASAGAQFPGPGQLMPLDAKSTGTALRMVILPFRYDADGSGRMPDLSDAQIALYKKTLLELYPTPDVEIRIHDPIPWKSVVNPNGDGWTDILQNLLFQRQQDRMTNQAAPDEYYFGLFAPATGFAPYCSSGMGCVLGLSSTALDPADEFFRGSVGVGFTGVRSAKTMAHETGHAHGRLHSPCAPGGFIKDIDPSYPHPDAQIGTWGYDIVAKSLWDPSGDVRDIMGYCDPTWVSDYTYDALFDRMQFVSSSTGAAYSGGGSAAPYVMVSVDGQGRLARGPTVTLSAPGPGERRRVDVLDASGAVRRTVDAAFHPYSDLPGGLLLLPAPGPGDRSIVSRGRRLAL